MKRLNFMYNDQGMTLIEILGAITILSIVLIGFMSFYPHSILMSQKAEDDLTAINVAERVLTEVKADPQLIDEEWGPIEENQQNYYPIIEMVPQSDHDPTEIEYGLTRILIKIYAEKPPSESSRLSAQLYGYIELEGNQ